MYTISKYKVALTLIFSTFFYINTVIAQDCHEKSPNFVAKNDAYYNLDAGKILSDEEKDKINNLFETITKEWRGNWKGQSIEVECKGSDDALIKNFRNSKITTNFKLDSTNNLIVKAEAYFAEEKKIKLKTLKLLDDLNIFEIEFISKNNIVFSTRYRRSESEHKQLIETIYKIKNTSKSLLIQRIYYTNAIYTGEEKWSLGDTETE